jgi:hypothetical protein
MAKTAFKGSPVSTSGNLPAVGSVAPDFKLVKGDLSDATLSGLKGKKVVLNIFPSMTRLFVPPLSVASIKRLPARPIRWFSASPVTCLLLPAASAPPKA